MKVRRPAWVGWMLQTAQAGLEKNVARVMQEVRETGELSVLLSRVVRRQSLTRDERHRMTEQLKDLARVVPAIAIFAAPGGVFLLIALARVLPFSLLPSAFREEAAAPAPAEAAPVPVTEVAAEGEAAGVPQRDAVSGGR